MEFLANFFKYFWQKLLEWFWWILDSLFAPLRWFVDGIVLFIEWLVFTLFDGFLLAIVAVFETFDLSASFFSQSAGWLGLPDQLIWLITQLGLPQCFSFFGLALGIRLLLNLLPAAVTRL
jgi:hypothetical protein